MTLHVILVHCASACIGIQIYCNSICTVLYRVYFANFRTRNSLQYHLSTAHRDREPGPRGRPRTRPRTPLITESGNVTGSKSPNEPDLNPRHQVNVTNTFLTLHRSASFGLPPA